MKPINILNNYLENLNTNLVNIVILLIGIVITIIGVGFGFKNTSISTILISIGCSLIASSIVSFLSSKYIIKQNKIKELISIWGIEGIYKTRQEMNRSCDDHMKNLDNELDIIAFGLRSFRDSKGKEIEEKVKKGLKIKILTLNPNGEFAEKQDAFENETKGHTKKTIEDLAKWVDSIKQFAQNSENIQIKFYNNLPLDFYFREDDYIYVGPYLYGMTSQQTISYEYKKNGAGYSYYKDYFDKLWNDEKFCKSDIQLK